MTAGIEERGAANGTLLFALAIILIWTGITIGGSFAVASPDATLNSLESSGIMFAVLLAGLFVGVTAYVKGWWADLGLVGPRPAKTLLLLWLPAAYIVSFGASGMSGSQQPVSVIGFVAINTLMVGVSEELAFRGLLWSHVRQKIPFWTGFCIVTALFGMVHVLNGFITGDWIGSGMQAINAAATGALLLALRIRTGSLVIVIALHALWDFTLFFASASDVPTSNPSVAQADPILQLSTLAVVALPQLLYALFLVRNDRVRGNWRHHVLPKPNRIVRHSPTESSR